MLVLGIAAGLVAAGRAPAWLQNLWPSPAALVVAAVLVALICVLLGTRRAIVGSDPADYALVVRGFTVLAGCALLFIPLFGLSGPTSALLGRPAVVVAGLAAGLVAMAVGLLLVGGERRAALTVGLAGIFATYAILLAAVLSTQQSLIAEALLEVLSLRNLVFLAGLPLLAGAGTLVVLMTRRPVWRRQFAFLVGLLVWIAVTTALPAAAALPLFNGVAALPFAVGLVAVLSASQGRAYDEPRRGGGDGPGSADADLQVSRQVRGQLGQLALGDPAPGQSRRARDRPEVGAAQVDVGQPRAGQGEVVDPAVLESEPGHPG